ncbi:hypothetical protein JCM3775_000231 [Rhodotorula graminis]
MNQIQATKRINDYALETGDLSWHDQYKDSAYVNVGGLPPNLTEGDVVTIFSQYGEIVDINMPRDPQTGKPRGFAWLMYADQRSTVLAVDNLNGATVLGRTLRVDHVLNYKQLERDQESGKMKEREERSLAAHPDKFRQPGSDASDADSDSSHPSIDLDDPMRDYLIEQRRAAKKRRIESGGGGAGSKESKEEKRRRKEERRRKREERERRRAAGGGGSGKKLIASEEGRSERDRPSASDAGRRSERGASRDDGRRRDGRDGHERRREADDGERERRRRDDDEGDRYGDRRRGRDRDDDEYRRRAERDERRGDGRGKGSSGGMDAYADLERLVRGG